MILFINVTLFLDKSTETMFHISSVFREMHFLRTADKGQNFL